MPSRPLRLEFAGVQYHVIARGKARGANPADLLGGVAEAFALPRSAVLDRGHGHGQAYRCAVYLLRRVANEPNGRVARRFGISAPRVSQMQAEIEKANVRRPIRMVLERYKVKR